MRWLALLSRDGALSSLLPPPLHTSRVQRAGLPPPIPCFRHLESSLLDVPSLASALRCFPFSPPFSLGARSFFLRHRKCSAVYRAGLGGVVAPPPVQWRGGGDQRPARVRALERRNGEARRERGRGRGNDETEDAEETREKGRKGKAKKKGGKGGRVRAVCLTPADRRSG